MVALARPPASLLPLPAACCPQGKGAGCRQPGEGSSRGGEAEMGDAAGMQEGLSYRAATISLLWLWINHPHTQPWSLLASYSSCKLQRRLASTHTAFTKRCTQGVCWWTAPQDTSCWFGEKRELRGTPAHIGELQLGKNSHSCNISLMATSSERRTPPNGRVKAPRKAIRLHIILLSAVAAKQHVQFSHIHNRGWNRWRRFGRKLM